MWTILQCTCRSTGMISLITYVLYIFILFYYSDQLRLSLDEEMHDTWGFAFRDIVQHHKAWQEQRKKDKEAEVEAAEGGDEYGSGHGPEEEEGEGRGED